MTKFLLIIFILLCSYGCGNKDILDISKNLDPINKLPVFYISTNEDLLNKYETLRVVDLSELIPNIHDYEIVKESFWEIGDALEEEAINLMSNYAVLIKDKNCKIKIGYCQAKIINKIIKRN